MFHWNTKPYLKNRIEFHLNQLVIKIFVIILTKSVQS